MFAVGIVLHVFDFVLVYLAEETSDNDWIVRFIDLYHYLVAVEATAADFTVVIAYVAVRHCSYIPLHQFGLSEKRGQKTLSDIDALR